MTRLFVLAGLLGGCGVAEITLPCDSTFYADEDGDGWGDPDGAVVACAQPPGTVEGAGDCDDANPQVHPETRWFTDGDGDGDGAPGDFEGPSCEAPSAGLAPDQDDCDDTDPARNRSADEVCDGIDNDCDGQTDVDAVDATPGFEDNDGDGYGDDRYPLQGCPEFRDDEAAVGGDCVDSDETIHPGAEEVCDGEDQDCDGVPDNDAVDAWSWYADDDGDGLGDPTSTIVACEAPGGFVDNAEDCDDTDASVGAATPFWTTDADGDGYGDAASRDETCGVPPSSATTLGEDCDDAAPTVNPGAEEICLNGVDEDCDGTGNACNLAGVTPLEGLPTAQPLVGPGGLTHIPAGLGADAAFADLTGDGVLDAALVGNSAELLIVPGPLHANAGGQLVGAAAGAFVGPVAVAAPGDLDGDGHADLAVTFTEGSGGTAGATSVGVVTGLFSASWTTDDVDVWLTRGTGYRSALGVSLAGAGDADGDGVATVLIVEEEDEATRMGRVLGVEPTSSGVARDEAAFRVELTNHGDGATPLGAADVDGDGVNDVVLGLPSSNVTDGLVRVFSGHPMGTVAEGDADATLTSSDARMYWLGNALAVGDVDADGYDDLAVGGGRGAQVWLVPGPLDADATVEEVALAHTPALSSSSSLGGGLALADLDADGELDLLAGTPYASVGLTGDGGVRLWFGPLSGTLSAEAPDAWLHGTPYGYQGGGLHALGDADGDGFEDVVVAPLLRGADEPWLLTGSGL